MSNETNCFFKEFAEKLLHEENAIAELQADNVKREDELSDHEDRLDDLEQKVEAQDDNDRKIDDHEGRLDQLDEALAKLQIVIEDQRIRILQLETFITKAAQALTQI